jgi:glycosyltransferase involved in cell wall biosynthesis
LLGARPNAEVGTHLTRHQVLAVPSLYEAFGIAYLEAMGFGLPVLGTTAGAAGELITHAEHGFLVDPGDAAALAHHVRTLQHDRKRLQRMSLAAHRRARAHPTWDDCAGRVRGLIRQLVR